MATTIDDLVVTLNLDAQSFLHGQNKILAALDKIRKVNVATSKHIEATAKKQGDSFAAVTRSAMGFFAILMGARSVKDFASSMTEANASLARFGRALGESPQKIGAMSNLAERFGGSMQSTAATVNNVANALYNLNVNGKALPTEFYRLMAMTRTKIDIKNGPIKFLEDAAVALQKLAKTDPATARFIAQGMGIDEATLAAMVRYGAAFRSVMDLEAKRHSWSPAALAAAEGINESWVKMSQTARDLGGVIYEKLGPYISDLLQRMDAWLQKNKEWLAIEITKAVTSLATELQKIPWEEAARAAVAFLAPLRDIKETIEGINKFGQPVADTLNWLSKLGDPDEKDIKKSRAEAKPGEWYRDTPDGVAMQKGNLADWVKQGIFGKRALGGTTLGGRPYLVGEHGPEIFTPGSNGAISNNIFGSELKVMGREVSRSNPIPVLIQGGGNSSNLSFGGGGGGVGASFGGGGGSSGGGGASFGGGGGSSGGGGASASFSGGNGSEPGGLFAAIRKYESGNNYRSITSQWKGARPDITKMSIDQAIAFATMMRRHGVSDSAMGAYQINGTTLKDFRRQMGLSGTELFDQSMQDRIAGAIFRSTGGDPRKLKGRWTALRRFDDNTIRSMMSQGSSPSASDAPGVSKGVHPGITALEEALRERGIIDRVTSRRRYGRGASHHLFGRGIDMAVHGGRGGSFAAEKEIRALLAEAGITNPEVINEYVKKTANWTGPHMHAAFRNNRDAQRFADYWHGKKGVANVPSGSPQLASGVTNTVANDNRKSISASIGKIDVHAPGGDPKDIAYRVGGELRGVLPILAEGALK